MEEFCSMLLLILDKVCHADKQIKHSPLHGQFCISIYLFYFQVEEKKSCFGKAQCNYSSENLKQKTLCLKEDKQSSILYWYIFYNFWQPLN
jgi:hypothetical protein